MMLKNLTFYLIIKKSRTYTYRTTEVMKESKAIL